MTVGPFFGVRYRPPRVEIPVVTTPATDTDEDQPGYANSSQAAPAREGEQSGDDGVIV